jgi:hypothetical protein
VRAGPRQFAEKADLTGVPRCRERERARSGGVGATHCADKAGPQDRERTWARRRRRLAPTDQPHQVEGVGRERAGTHGRAGLEWAVLGRNRFSFSLEFLMPFLFIFPMVFKSNSNTKPNLNNFKHVHQTKE